MTCSWASHLSASESDLRSSWEEAQIFFSATGHWSQGRSKQVLQTLIYFWQTLVSTASHTYIKLLASLQHTDITVSFFRTICTPILFVFVCYWPIIVLQTTLLCGWSLAKKSCQSPQTWDAWTEIRRRRRWPIRWQVSNGGQSAALGGTWRARILTRRRRRRKRRSWRWSSSPTGSPRWSSLGRQRSVGSVLFLFSVVTSFNLLGCDRAKAMVVVLGLVQKQKQTGNGCARTGSSEFEKHFSKKVAKNDSCKTKRLIFQLWWL